MVLGAEPTRHGRPQSRDRGEFKSAKRKSDPPVAVASAQWWLVPNALVVATEDGISVNTTIEPETDVLRWLVPCHHKTHTRSNHRRGLTMNTFYT